jgi:hypothetical protein
MAAPTTNERAVFELHTKRVNNELLTLGRPSQAGARSNHQEIRLRRCAAVLHRIQQLRIDPGQRLRIQPIVFLSALPDQPHLARIGHDYFMPQRAEQATDPGRMRPDFQRDPTAWHCGDDFLQRLRVRTDWLLQLGSK